MTTPDQTKIEELQKEIKVLAIKLETLVNYLNAQGRFGPPNGRVDYDAMVTKALATESR